MRIFPVASAVLIAEHRLEQSKQQLREQLNQARSRLTQPSNLLIVTGVGALLGIWLTPRKTPAAMSNGASVSSPVRNLLFILLIRFILQRITKRGALR